MRQLGSVGVAILQRFVRCLKSVGMPVRHSNVPPVGLNYQVRQPKRLTPQEVGANERTASQWFKSGSKGMIANEEVVTP